MNLIEYGEIEGNIDRSKTWINVKYRTLITREVKKRKYTIVMQRYNKMCQLTEYFVAFSDTQIPNKINHLTKVDDYGRIKVRLNDIWNTSNLKNFKYDCNIIFTLIEIQDDGEIYKIEI